MRSISLDVGANYQSFKLGEITLTEISVPLQVVVPLSDQMSFSLGNIPVMVSRTAPDTSIIKVNNQLTSKVSDKTVNITTQTDTRVGFKYLFLDNRALLSLNLNIPTGKTKLNEDDFNVETQLGLGILKYRMPVFGQGFNLGGSFIYAIPITKRNILGLGVTFDYKSKYTPVTSVDYDPGEDYGVNLSYTYIPLSGVRFSFDAAFINFLKDKITFVASTGTEEKNINLEFQSGFKLNLVAQFNLQSGSIQHWLILQDRIRGKNKQQIATPNVVNNKVEWLYEWKDFTNGQQLEALYNLMIPLSPIFSVSALANVRMYGAGQDNWNGVVIESENSTIYGGGLGLRAMLMDNLGLDISGKYLTGKVKLQQEYNITGLELIAKLNFLF
jgi:hypothetical protein